MYFKWQSCLNQIFQLWAQQINLYSAPACLVGSRKLKKPQQRKLTWQAVSGSKWQNIIAFCHWPFNKNKNLTKDIHCECFSSLGHYKELKLLLRSARDPTKTSVKGITAAVCLCFKAGKNYAKGSLAQQTTDTHTRQWCQFQERTLLVKIGKSADKADKTSLMCSMCKSNNNDNSFEYVLLKPNVWKSIEVVTLPFATNWACTFDGSDERSKWS